MRCTGASGGADEALPPPPGCCAATASSERASGFGAVLEPLAKKVRTTSGSKADEQDPVAQARVTLRERRAAGLYARDSTSYVDAVGAAVES